MLTLASQRKFDILILNKIGVIAIANFYLFI